MLHDYGTKVRGYEHIGEEELDSISRVEILKRIRFEWGSFIVVG